MEPVSKRKKTAKTGKSPSKANPLNVLLGKKIHEKHDDIKLGNIDVILVVKEPELQMPVKRSIQDDIANKVEHSDKKRCATGNGADEKHYVFSLSRGGFDILSGGDESATVFRAEWGQKTNQDG